MIDSHFRVIWHFDHTKCQGCKMNFLYCLSTYARIRFCCLKIAFTMQHAFPLDNIRQRSKRSAIILIIFKYKLR